MLKKKWNLKVEIKSIIGDDMADYRSLYEQQRMENEAILFFIIIGLTCI